MADSVFAEPRLAEIYDPLDPDRSDLDVYAAMAEEFGGRSVLDVGCGTGTLACLLAACGRQVIAVDPAAASLEVARRKPGAGGVRWLNADVPDLPPLQIDLVTMTGNVAQVFITDQEWVATLGAAREALRPGAGWCSRAEFRRRRHGWSGTATRPTAVSSSRAPARSRRGLT